MSNIRSIKLKYKNDNRRLTFNESFIHFDSLKKEIQNLYKIENFSMMNEGKRIQNQEQYNQIFKKNILTFEIVDGSIVEDVVDESTSNQNMDLILKIFKEKVSKEGLIELISTIFEESPKEEMEKIIKHALSTNKIQQFIISSLFSTFRNEENKNRNVIINEPKNQREEVLNESNDDFEREKLLESIKKEQLKEKELQREQMLLENDQHQEEINTLKKNHQTELNDLRKKIESENKMNTQKNDLIETQYQQQISLLKQTHENEMQKKIIKLN